MNTKTYDEIVKEMKDRAIASISGVTDFNQGSVIMTIFESVARPMEQAYIDTRNGYANNLRAIPYSIFGFGQKNGQKATVRVVFTRNAASSYVSNIPVGTRVSNGNLIFVTTQAGTIGIGETVSASIEAQAENVGIEYNLGANSITNIESALSSEIVSVNNPNKATGGTDAETQTQMFKRFKAYVNGLQGSNRYGIEAGLLGLEGVRSVGLQEHFPPKDGIYNVTVYVDDGTGQMTEELRTQCMDLVNGNDTEANPGLRAAGVNIDFQAASAIYVDVKVTISIYRVEAERVQDDVQRKVQEYINGLGIHENVVVSSLIVLLKQIQGITDITGLMLKTTEEWSSDNVVIGINQIARFNEIDITINQE